MFDVTFLAILLTHIAQNCIPHFQIDTKMNSFVDACCFAIDFEKFNIHNILMCLPCVPGDMVRYFLYVYRPNTTDEDIKPLHQAENENSFDEGVELIKKFF